MAKHGRFLVVVLLGLCAGFAVLGCESGGAVQVLDVQPRTGHMAGEQPVRIIGKNFRPDIGYTVYFGTKKTSSVTIRDPETLDVVTPAGMPAGKVDIMLRADDGNAFRIKQSFEFVDMGGSVVGGMGGPASTKGQEKGNLAY
jgi:hypothetical protein